MKNALLILLAANLAAQPMPANAFTTQPTLAKVLKTHPHPVNAARRDRTPEPVLVRGQIFQGDARYLLLSFTNSLQEEALDTIAVENGRFTIPASRISGPQIAFLEVPAGDDNLWIPVLLAPDYRLSLKINMPRASGVARDPSWSGHGSAINKYYTALKANVFNYSPSYNDPAKPFNSDSAKSSFDRWYRDAKRRADSLFTRYGRLYTDPQDPHFAYFKSLMHDDMMFQRLDPLLRQALAMLDNKTPAETDGYIRENFDPRMLRNIGSPHYLSSPHYKDLMGFSYAYLFYLVKHDLKTGIDTAADRYTAHLKKIDAVFHGKTREYILYKFIGLNLVEATNSYEGFSTKTLLTMPYLDGMHSKCYREKLLGKITKKEAALSKLKSGNPAPPFALTDDHGGNHALGDFKGKLVIIDFWASWCSYCRKETPYLEALYEKYRSDTTIQFLSIAVNDKKEDWLKALQQDKPGSLQLFDDKGMAGAYFTNAIPKFVIIDRYGLIAGFQAPLPSEGDKLERLIKEYLPENHLTEEKRNP